MHHQYSQEPTVHQEDPTMVVFIQSFKLVRVTGRCVHLLGECERDANGTDMEAREYGIEFVKGAGIGT